MQSIPPPELYTIFLKSLKYRVLLTLLFVFHPVRCDNGFHLGNRGETHHMQLVFQARNIKSNF